MTHVVYLTGFHFLKSIDLPAVIRALAKINYTGLVSFEYEKPNFDKDPLPGLAESVGYIRGILATI